MNEIVGEIRVSVLLSGVCSIKNLGQVRVNPEFSNTLRHLSGRYESRLVLGNDVFKNKTSSSILHVESILTAILDPVEGFSFRVEFSAAFDVSGSSRQANSSAKGG